MARRAFELDGVDQMVRRFRDIQPGVRAAALQAINEEGNEVMTEAKRQTPVDTGSLRASARVEPVAAGRDKVEVVLSFGGAAREYAVYVHEDMNARHTNGKAKFLEDPLKARASSFVNNLRLRIGAIMRLI